MAREKEMRGFSGWLMVFVLLAAGFITIYGLIRGIRVGPGELVLASAIAYGIQFVCYFGFTVVNPNEAKVITLFGVYKGSLKQPGFWWINPLTTRRRFPCAFATLKAAS